MKKIQRASHIILFLAAAGLLLPACGSKSTVKSEKATETVLNPESTPTTASPSSHRDESDSYTAKIHSKAGNGSTAAGTNATTAAAPPVASGTPAMETTATAADKGGFPTWILWVLGIAALGGLGYMAWAKRQAAEESQPMPPVGGLSPVSGFTALKDQIEEETPKPSFWSKKLF